MEYSVIVQKLGGAETPDILPWLQTTLGPLQTPGRFTMPPKVYHFTTTRVLTSSSSSV